MSDESMKLPEGKTCADCYACRHCTAIYGVKPENTKCDFYPVRFTEIAVRIQELAADMRGDSDG